MILSEKSFHDENIYPGENTKVQKVFIPNIWRMGKEGFEPNKIISYGHNRDNNDTAKHLDEIYKVVST